MITDLRENLRGKMPYSCSSVVLCWPSILVTVAFESQWEYTDLTFDSLQSTVLLQGEVLGLSFHVLSVEEYSEDACGSSMTYLEDVSELSCPAILGFSF